MSTFKVKLYDECKIGVTFEVTVDANSEEEAKELAKNVDRVYAKFLNEEFLDLVSTSVVDVDQLE